MRKILFLHGRGQSEQIFAKRLIKLTKKLNKYFDECCFISAPFSVVMPSNKPDAKEPSPSDAPTPSTSASSTSTSTSTSVKNTKDEDADNEQEGEQQDLRAWYYYTEENRSEFLSFLHQPQAPLLGWPTTLALIEEARALV